MRLIIANNYILNAWQYRSYDTLRIEPEVIGPDLLAAEID